MSVTANGDLLLHYRSFEVFFDSVLVDDSVHATPKRYQIDRTHRRPLKAPASVTTSSSSTGELNLEAV